MSKFISALYHPELLTVEYVDENGDRLLRSGGTIAWRFNNPGNLRPGPKYVLHIGKGNTKSGDFLIFPTAEDGRAEKKGLLLRKYNKDTVAQMMEQYAPRKENDTDKYIAYITNKSGVGKQDVVGKLSESNLAALMKAMEQYEGFNAKADTRQEKWVRSTKVTLSDGARPIIGQEVTVKLGGTELKCVTGSGGQLPAIAHTVPGQRVELWVNNVANQPEQLDCFVLGETSQKFTYFRNLMVAQGNTRAHIASSVPDKKPPEPFTYIVQPNDTLGKIAAKFKTSAEKIQKDNKIRNPRLIMPSQKLLINKGEYSGATVSNIHKSRATNAPLAAVSERSKDGQGQPLGIIPVDQKRAPWMQFALDEAKAWGKVDEKEITKTKNYHKLASPKGGLNSLAGDSNPWCASFVSWCLLQAEYAITTEPARSRSFEKSDEFRKISEPIYGAIAVFERGKSASSGHVCFVYSHSTTAGHIVVLGGNQGDKITFESRSAKKKLIGFFVPEAYALFAKQEIDLKTEMSEVNLASGIVVPKKGKAKES